MHTYICANAFSDTMATTIPTNPALYPAPESDEYAEAARMQVQWLAKHWPARFTDMSSPRGVFKGTREEWLEAAAIIMGGWIDFALTQTSRVQIHRGRSSVKAVPVSYSAWLVDRYGGKPSDYRFNPATTRYACSLMDSGMTKAGSLAHVHYMHATGNRYDEIRMSVEVGGRKRKDDSCRVADILLHEMIHTCARHHGHGGAFASMAATMGLTGRMTATVATPDLRQRIWDDVVSVLGRYPHAKVHLTPRGQRGRGSRLIKCTCPSCGFNMRTTRKWLNAGFAQQGHIGCPLGCAPPMVHPDYDPSEELLQGV